MNYKRLIIYIAVYTLGFANAVIGGYLLKSFFFFLFYLFLFISTGHVLRWMKERRGGELGRYGGIISTFIAGAISFVIASLIYHTLILLGILNKGGW